MPNIKEKLEFASDTESNLVRYNASDEKIDISIRISVEAQNLERRGNPFFC